jgi:hypothetical protein
VLKAFSLLRPESPFRVQSIVENSLSCTTLVIFARCLLLPVEKRSRKLGLSTENFTQTGNRCPLHSNMTNVQQESQTEDSSDWRGPDDLDCPYNWPMRKRIYMTSIPALLCINV